MRLYRRAIVIYIVTIVLPAAVLVWLGTRAFETQRQNLEKLRMERFADSLKTAMREAGQKALADGVHPIARYFFTMEQGEITRPVLRSPLPDPVPEHFAEALRLEATEPETALASYRRLLAARNRESLALAGIARCLGLLGREAEARETWRRLAATYPDDRDLSHRPYGVIAARFAGDVEGLFDKVVSGRWELAADWAVPLLSNLAPDRTSPYQEQVAFARDVAEQFRPPGAAAGGEVYEYALRRGRLLYRADGDGRIHGFAVNEEWIENTLAPDIRSRLPDAASSSAWFYGGAIGLVVLMLSAGLLLLFRDVSRELRANRQRSDFVSGVSHELKTPITLIRLYSETLLRHASLKEAERADFNRVIMRESDRLGRLVDQILTFSRVESGDRLYTLKEGDPAPVVARVVEDYREYLEQAGFSLKDDVPESAATVRFDPAALSQALVNLLDNAVKYSGASREIAVTLAASNGQVAIEVEDHGIGIAAAEQPRIFERFYRVANGSGKGGYGLGLFLVRHIMEAHGGRAEVESAPGRGSRFRLVFPGASV
jgi:signal transduction histidine kinase